MQGLTRIGAAPAVIRDNNIDTTVFPLLHQIEACDRGFRKTAPGGVQKLAWQELDLPVDAGDADAVVAQGANRPGDVRAMAVVIHGIARVRDHVEAMHSGGTLDYGAELR